MKFRFSHAELCWNFPSAKKNRCSRHQGIPIGGHLKPVKIHSNMVPRGLRRAFNRDPIIECPHNPSNITATWYRGVQGGPLIGVPLCREA